MQEPQWLLRARPYGSSSAGATKEHARRRCDGLGQPAALLMGFRTRMLGVCPLPIPRMDPALSNFSGDSVLTEPSALPLVISIEAMRLFLRASPTRTFSAASRGAKREWIDKSLAFVRYE